MHSAPDARTPVTTRDPARTPPRLHITPACTEYWKPVFYCLEERMECWLLNAAHMKAVPGRKTDVKDAEWIAQLLEHGLLTRRSCRRRGSGSCDNLTRYRSQLMGGRTRDADRLEKLLEDASIKLTSVGSNITGTSSREMLHALVDGERDPAVMADMAYSTLRRKIPDLTEALTGRFDEHHAVLVGALLTRLEHTEAALRQIDAELVVRMMPFARQLELLRTIPGVGLVTAQVFLAETGGDMSRFGSPEQLAAGSVSLPRCTSPPASGHPQGRVGATSGCARCWSRPRTPRRGRRTPTWLRSSKRIASRRGHGRASESPRAGEADFILAKHRNRPTANITVAFQGHYSRVVGKAQS